MSLYQRRTFIISITTAVVFLLFSSCPSVFTEMPVISSSDLKLLLRVELNTL